MIKILFISVLPFLLVSFAMGQATISGKVTDSFGNPLGGATVTVQGTSISTLTTDDGRYILASVPPNATLQFSFVGMKTREVPVDGSEPIHVELVAEATEMEEAVVVGYGVQKKAHVIGSVSTLSTEEITATPSPNVSSALSGRVPGLFVAQSSGRPGADGASLNIRGKATIGYRDEGVDNTAVLVVIDGVPGRDLNSIEPGDIESLSVLKDASAAIYGSRAANGVILVTTKSGRESPPRFEFDFYSGWSSASVLPKMTDAATYATMIRERSEEHTSELQSRANL